MTLMINVFCVNYPAIKELKLKCVFKKNIEPVSSRLMSKGFGSYRFVTGACLKPLTVFLMSLLLFLTVLNYFAYSTSSSKAGTENVFADTEEGSGGLLNTNPAGPDEKSPDTPVSITEEFIHKHTELADPFWINCYFKYIVAGSEQLYVTHFEILSPPPDSLI
jgi:hypothetical protein